MVALTFDVDWAPDWMIARTAERLEARGIASTWFVTHATPALARLRARPDLFELGIHPNFLPGSTHGTTTAEVLDHVMAIVPEAVSARAHGMVCSSPLLGELRRRVRIDSSTFLPGATLGPVRYATAAGELVRIPATWADDYEAALPAPDWRPRAGVLLFHPVRVALNIARQEDYARLKPRLGALSAAEAAQLAGAGEGPASALDRLLETLADGEARRLRDLA
jgi:hypothetical protein